MNRSIVAALVVALGAGAALGGGIATAASKSPTIHACERKSSGALRIAKHCRASERVVTWNTTGKEGPRGPAGSSFAATFDFPDVAVSNNVSEPAIPLTALPNGDYTYAVTVTFTNGDSGTYYATCNIRGQDLGSVFFDNQQSSVIPPSLGVGTSDEFSPGAMTLVGTFGRSSNTFFEPACYTGDSGSNMTMTVDVVFTRVSKVVDSAS